VKNLRWSWLLLAAIPGCVLVQPLDGAASSDGGSSSGAGASAAGSNSGSHAGSGNSHAGAAGILGVHKNTVRNRLRDVEEILGTPLSSRSAEVQVALRLDRILRREKDR